MFFAWMYAYPGKKLMFMGGEFGQWREWNHDQSLDWHLLDYPFHAGLRRLVQHLNYVYKTEPALWQLDDSYEGFEWIDFHDAESSIVVFLRKGENTPAFVFLVNATPVPKYGYRIGVPSDGWYEEVINTDAETYGGGNIGNYGGMHADAIPWQGRSHSISVTLPPLGVVAFKRHEYKS
jgi:1,4-alpha-glucan branching enzyme